MHAPGPAELEIKLRLAPRQAPLLLRHPALLPLKRGRSHVATLRSTYFDTPKRRLAAAGVGLRVRRAGRRWLQTVKGPLDERSGGGLAARPEYEWPLRVGTTMPPLDPARLADTPWRRTLAKALADGVAPVFVTTFKRTTVPLVFADSTMASLALDVGTIRLPHGGRAVAFCEVEIELESGHAHNLFELARALAADIDLVPEGASKAARGYALAAAAPSLPQPRRAVDADLPKSASTCDALAAILRSCLRQVDGNADGTATDDDPEWIHQMRIGTRRLRACLSLLRDIVPEATLAPIVTEVRWLAQTLGTARDLDVLAAETLPGLARALRSTGEAQGAQGLPSLRARVARRRSDARTAVRVAVRSRRYVDLVLAVGALAARPHFGVDAGTPAARALGMRARVFARPLLAHRQRVLLRRGAGLPAAAPPARHAARLAAKRLRYATEFFAPLFARKRTRAYQAALERLQDVLGVLNDATVAADLAAALVGAAAPATATLRGWSAAQAAMRSDELAAAWHHFLDARPFWARK